MNLKKTLLVALVAAAVPALYAADAKVKQITWNFDNLNKIGGLPVKVEGHPKVIESPVGKAVEFDGVGDSLLIEEHPLAGAETFTFEAIFRPDGGAEAAENVTSAARRGVRFIRISGCRLSFVVGRLSFVVGR